MIQPDQFKMREGGLHTAILPFEPTVANHCLMLGGILRDAICHEAKLHDSAFDDAGFRNVMRAMTSGDVEVLFFAAAWDLCKPKIIGATINFRSLSMQRDGDDLIVKNGIYSEDVCILPSRMRGLVAELPEGNKFPSEGLGIHFIQESMRHFAQKGMRDGAIPAGQTFEFAPHNTKIVKIQEQLGASLGADSHSGLLRIAELTDTIRNKWTMPVEILGVPLPDGRIDPNNFIVRWRGASGRQKIDAGFTKGISTFKGSMVTQGQIISNGELPRPAMVESVMASILKAAEQEIRARRWGKLDSRLPKKRSPSIPLLGNKRQAYSALLAVQNDELFAPPISEGESAVFGAKPPPMHIHALNEPEILAGLRSLDVENRMLGSNAMQTASLDLEKSGASKGAVRPLKLIGSEAAHIPLFSLVA
ncbi:MAG: hypothetical protein WDO70_06020 [Alphaproteobacteria bacterium]